MRLYITLITYFTIFLSTAIYSQTREIAYLEQSLIDQKLINAQELIPSLWVDLKYASTDNFTGVVLYEKGFSNAYLHPLALQKLKKAQEDLQKLQPELSLLIYDAARPISVQKKMFDVVKDTPKQAYVANPKNTGLHNYGMAVDLTICNNKGVSLDMGTTFDFFGKAAAIRNEDKLIEEKVLTKKQVENRRLLRKVMINAGFRTVQGEWWHFNAIPLNAARSHYTLIE